MRCRSFALAIVLSLIPVFHYAQHSITATEVENWASPELPGSDFNLNSAYVYLINPHALEGVFGGEDLNRNQLKELGLKRSDYPQYMYLAVSLENPLDEDGGELTIPLMIHDVRNPLNQSRLVEYGGRFLENIPDEVLKDGDILARVKFEAIKSNTTDEFWKKTAKISIDLGKTATRLLQAPVTGTLATLTQQIIPQVDQGLQSMDHADDPVKMTSEFYIRLLSRQLSALYEERVVSAALYRIHWDVEEPPASRFLRKGGFQSVDEVKAAVNHNHTPYILVVNTKSEYNTDHSELVYNQGYIEKKSRDFRKIRNVRKKEVEKAFLETLKTAVELKKQMEIFQSSLNTKYPEWQAYSRVIDLYYDLRELKNEEVARLAGEETAIREKYERLYANVQTDVDLWFQTDLLARARDIASFLVDMKRPYGEVAPVKTARQIYEDLQLLDFYRDRARRTEIQGKLPKEIESLDSYSLTLARLREIETALYQRAFQVSPELSPEQQKNWLTDKATRSYPLCQICNQQVGQEIARIENLTHEENIRKYRNISAAYYEKLECYDGIFTKLNEIIRTNTDSLTISPFMLEALRKDREELIHLSAGYADLMGKDHTSLEKQELSDLLSKYYLLREKLDAVIRRLRGAVLQDADIPCLQVRP